MWKGSGWVGEREQWDGRGKLKEELFSGGWGHCENVERGIILRLVDVWEEDLWGTGEGKIRGRRRLNWTD